MATETYQLSDSAAATYEEQKVPAVFAPLAKATLDAIEISANDALLDVACGTGIFARLARERMGPRPRIAGVDLNKGMIAMARSLSAARAQHIDWEVADAGNLPFPDQSFSVAICQQGIQFFPDEIAALTEMMRVIRPGGRVVLSVWTGPNEFFTALADALSRHVSAEIGQRSLAPFGYDGGNLSDRLAATGFAHISTTQVSVDRIINEPPVAIPKEILANPVGPAVAEMGASVMGAIVEDVTAAMKGFRRGAGIVVPQHAYLVQGVRT